VVKTVPVLIAGGGPVGLSLAYDLASRGIGCMLVERNASTTRHPKMDITNSRSMELFRSVGLADRLRAVAVPEEHPFDVSWVTSMVGYELHRFRYPSVSESRVRTRDQNDGTQPLEPPMRVSQVEIEPVLKHALEEQPLAEVRFGVALGEFTQDAESVTATLCNMQSGCTEVVRCLFLVGCDGGGSTVRKGLEIGLQGQLQVMQRYLTHFRSDARDLLQRWGISWHYQSNLGTLVAQDDVDTWTLHSRFATDTAAGAVDPRRLVEDFVGARITFELLVANPWTPHLVVAESYARGRVFLAGDAAHQYIPTGGYGMNTGVGDAFDLSWKLAGTLKGFGGPRLLSSYEAERRPVGLRNCAASELHNRVRRQIGSRYTPLVHDPSDAGALARAELATFIAQAGNAENESAGIELGYQYTDSPVVWNEPGPETPDDGLYYQPSTRPGSRLPSTFLSDGTPLYDRLGRWFTLLSFDGRRSQTLLRSARARGMPLRYVTVVAPDLREIYGTGSLLVRPDQHIAWRGVAPDDASQADTIVGRALGYS
jgi:2-polyprenyl-6-methoxyphenol hydroxylase-like FAD-dependent oxidoreductase